MKLVRFSLSAADNEKANAGLLRKSGSEAVSEQVLSFEELDSLAISGVTELLSQDLDNDGEEELVISTNHTNNSASQSGVTIAKINSNTLQPAATLGNASAKGVSLADFNGDGELDVLVANDNDSYQFYYGDGTATRWQLKETMIFNPSTLVLPEDLDNDGLSDVLIYEEDTDEVNLYISAADGTLGQNANVSIAATATVLSNSAYQWRYVATVTNPAAQAISNVNLSVNLPAGISVATKPEACSASGSTITCSVDSLPPGSEAFTFVLAASRKPSGSATATVTSDALDSDTTNNAASTALSPLFTETQVRVEGGGKSGGAAGGLFALLLTGLLVLRTGSFARVFKVALAFLALCAASVKADEKWYAEASLGKASSHWQASDLHATMNANAQEMTVTDIDDDRGTQELLLGYRIKPMLAVELGYRDWGEISYNLEGVASNPEAVLNATQSHYPASGKGAFAGVRASYWHGDTLEGYVKLSAWDWTGEYTTLINGQSHRYETGDTDVVISAGMNGYFFERYSAGVMYQTTQLEGQRNTMLGVSLGVRF